MPKTTKKSSPFRVLEGGLDSGPSAAPHELHRTMIGVARIKTPAEEPHILSYLMSIRPTFKLLTGRVLGIFDERCVATAGHTKRQPCYLVRYPALSESSERAIYMPKDWFVGFRSQESTGPFNDKEHLQQEMLRDCFLADRIYLIHEAMVKLPDRPTQGINPDEVRAWQQAALDWLTSGVASNTCEECGKEIPRFVYREDPESGLVGPVRQRCHEHYSR